MSDISINSVMNLQAAQLGTQIGAAVLAKGKELIEQEGSNIMQLIDSVPQAAPVGSSGHNINIKV